MQHDLLIVLEHEEVMDRKDVEERWSLDLQLQHFHPGKKLDWKNWQLFYALQSNVVVRTFLVHELLYLSRRRKLLSDVG